MIQRMVRAGGAIAGTVALLLGLLALGAGLAPAGLVGAQELPPRPTVAPTAPPRTGGGDSGDEEPGRITGTVIDQTTGAPAPGIAVLVGDVTVRSDANGNYDRPELASGVYTVTLVLSADQGTASQPAQRVTVASGATVVQHLFFRSPVRAATTAVATPLPTPLPTPASLPNTGAAEPSPALPLLGAALIGLGLALLALRRRARL
ncbi:MAG TPA: carboxypeptidase regulatory-like domain-containing protein [Roseiflexaceae bacterium]|nr:carboxypeptidase regulatory-like domain-containing protein [Roseiflexaceae bacterium]